MQWLRTEVLEKMAQNLHREGKSVYEEKKGKKKGLPKGGLSLEKMAQNLHREGKSVYEEKKGKEKKKGLPKGGYRFLHTNYDTGCEVGQTIVGVLIGVLVHLQESCMNPWNHD
jgi:hypothetical protein